MLDFERKRLMFRFLTGSLSESEQADLEDRYCKDDELFHELVALENDLIDAYARGNLLPEDRIELERSFFNTPRRRERLEFARSMGLVLQPNLDTSLVAQERKSQFRRRLLTWAGGSWPNFRLAGFAVALILCLALIGPVVLNRLGQDRTRVRVQDDAANLSNARAPEMPQLPRLQARPTQYSSAKSAAVFYRLDPGLWREGGKQQEIRISSSAYELILQLLPEPGSTVNCSACVAVVKTAEGKLIWHGRIFQSLRSGRSEEKLLVKLPTGLLQNGDYILKLRETQELTSEEVVAYSFRIRRVRNE